MTVISMIMLYAVAIFVSADINNEHVSIDMVQNNPGDAVAWQQTKYFNPSNIAALNFTGMTTTGEMSGTQAVDFHTLGGDFFPQGSAERVWLDNYKNGIHAWVNRCVAAGVKPYFFVDLLVFPTPVLNVWKNATGSVNIKATRGYRRVIRYSFLNISITHLITLIYP